MNRVKKFFKSPWLWGLLFGIAVVHLVRPVMRHVPEPPPFTGKLSPYSLKNMYNESFGSKDLAGKTYLISWIKEECEDSCLILMHNLKKIQSLYKRDRYPIELVSVCVNCVNKSNFNLKEFASNWTTNFTTWHFLEGKYRCDKTAKEICSEQFYKEDEVLSASKIAIIDGDGNIRGTYNSDDNGADEAYHRATHVLRENRRKK
jgi:protein SCO1